MTSTTKVKVEHFHPHNKIVIDFNFDRHDDLSTLIGLVASVNITFQVDKSSCLVSIIVWKMTLNAK